MAGQRVAAADFVPPLRAKDGAGLGVSNIPGASVAATSSSLAATLSTVSGGGCKQLVWPPCAGTSFPPAALIAETDGAPRSLISPMVVSWVRQHVKVNSR